MRYRLLNYLMPACIAIAMTPILSAGIPPEVFAHRKELPAPTHDIPSVEENQDFLPAPEPRKPRLSRYRFKPPAELIEKTNSPSIPKKIKLELQLNQLGRLYEHDGDWEQALRAYRAAVQENPHFLLPYYNLLRIYRGINREDQVRTVLRELLLVKPDDFSANSQLSDFYFDRGEYSKARPFCENLVKYYPEDGLSWYNLGIVAVHEGNSAEAMACFRKSRETSFSINFKNVLGLPAFESIRNTQEFRDFAEEVGWASTSTQDAGTTLRSVLFQQREGDQEVLNRQQLLSIGQMLLDLGTDQTEEIIYNIAIYNGPEDLFELLQTRSDQITGISALASQADALMLLYSSSPNPLDHFGEAQLEPIIETAAELDLSLEWFPIQTSSDQMTVQGSTGEDLNLPLFGVAAIRWNRNMPEFAPSSATP
jgi:tetratricopeptide (TPR) repeat protein